MVAESHARERRDVAEQCFGDHEQPAAPEVSCPYLGGLGERGFAMMICRI